MTLGCRARRTMAAATRVATSRVLLVVMAPWTGTTGSVLSPLVRSYGGVCATDVQEPNVEEPCMEQSS
jgi:hypothetical protein